MCCTGSICVDQTTLGWLWLWANHTRNWIVFKKRKNVIGRLTWLGTARDWLFPDLLSKRHLWYTICVDRTKICIDKVVSVLDIYYRATEKCFAYISWFCVNIINSVYLWLIPGVDRLCERLGEEETAAEAYNLFIFKAEQDGVSSSVQFSCQLECFCNQLLATLDHGRDRCTTRVLSIEDYIRLLTCSMYSN